ncbi:hypothetical protein [Nocardioides sp.]|uniref:hypothetical protein n=1 Tax=Nocardioides sp. TaxID=35761 RepID=UPI00262EC28D|nr:hypothetical protein [Nocardioides sp.]MDI6911467.1 hypothetical protein [Nocardioides sp.]
MSGVQVGSRVEQLERLLARVEQELAAERLKLRTDAVDTRGGIRTHTAAPASRIVAAQRRANEPVPLCSRVIKVWAHEQGLIEYVPRGRVRPELVEAYEKAHGIKVTIEAAR